MIQFPQDFLWGAATSAYQVEGNNVNCDWWIWEKKVGLKGSGEACRHYSLYKEDFSLAKSLYHNTHRLSIEWSRIEPQENRFSTQEIEHYRDVIISLRENNLEPIVTLHHFTNPVWFANLGGWQNKKADKYFLRYVAAIVGALADKVHYWITINEPMVYVYHSYLLGLWPPEKKSVFLAKKVVDNLILSHINAYRLIHSLYKKRNLSLPKVSIAKNLQAFIPYRSSLKNRLAVYLRDRYFNFKFIERLIQHKSLDFIGINYYTRSLVDLKKWGFKNLLLDTYEKNDEQLQKNSLGWDIYPQGLYQLLLKLKKYELSILITENGICTQDDNLRWNFICGHLENIHLAMEEGVKIMGYIYWSLIDNFEWDKGFSPHFGLIGVDYNTYQRTVRESAKKFALVCKTGRLG